MLTPTDKDANAAANGAHQGNKPSNKNETTTKNCNSIAAARVITKKKKDQKKADTAQIEKKEQDNIPIAMDTGGMEEDNKVAKYKSDKEKIAEREEHISLALRKIYNLLVKIKFNVKNEEKAYPIHAELIALLKMMQNIDAELKAKRLMAPKYGYTSPKFLIERSSRMHSVSGKTTSRQATN
eukprot:12371594-Ditylum_brightwellii.AAC.1